MSLRGYFCRALHLPYFDNKMILSWVFALIRAHLLPLIKKSQQWLYYLYYPSLGFFIERGICTLLSTNECRIVTECKLRQWAVHVVQPIAVFIGRAWYLPRSDNRRQTERIVCLHTMQRCEGGRVGYAEPTKWFYRDNAVFALFW